MFRPDRLDRRSFLKSAGVTAALGALGGTGNLAAQSAQAAQQARDDYDFDEVIDRFGTDSTKWDGAVDSFGEGIEVGMGISDMDFRAPPCVTRALEERMKHQNWGYLRTPASYARAIADWNGRRYGLDVDPRTVTLTTGVHPGIIAGLHAFAPPGSRVLMTSPVYNGFYGSLRFARTVAEDSPMKLVDGKYEIDFDDFEQRASRSNVFVLCNPHNPTGNCWSRDDLMRLGEICLERRVIVFADEIWCDVVMEGSRYTPFASLPDRRIVDNSITFKSASKSFNLSAMKAAWYFSTNPDLLERIRSYTRTDLSTLALVTNMAALTEGDDWLDQVVPYLDRNHDFTAAFIRERMPLVKYRKAEATYLAWLDVSGLLERIGTPDAAVPPSQVAQRWFAENAKVFLTPGSGFGTGGAHHLRMNIGTPRATLAKALGNMAEALSRV
jgi:cysteine-S-conjugate beta-lyase